MPGALATGAIGNALLGHSPDSSAKAVFAVITADGAVLQAHAAKGVDGLAPAGTIHPLNPNGVTRVAEPSTNSIATLPLSDDGMVFHTEAAKHLTAPELAVPVDLTPAVPEIAHPDFSSNTTLAGGSDLYIANNGNGTLVRMRQDGKILAARTLIVAGVGELGANRLQGIAVSPDATKLWVTVSGALPDYPDSSGAVLEVAAFGAGGAL